MKKFIKSEKIDTVSYAVDDTGTLEIWYGNKVLSEVSDVSKDISDNELDKLVDDVLDGLGYIWNDDGTLTSVSGGIKCSSGIDASVYDDDLFIVCEHCLEEIESREGHQTTTKDIPESRLYEVDEYNEYSGETYPEVVGICDWCEEEYPEDELVRII